MTTRIRADGRSRGLPARRVAASPVPRRRVAAARQPIGYCWWSPVPAPGRLPRCALASERNPLPLADGPQRADSALNHPRRTTPKPSTDRSRRARPPPPLAIADRPGPGRGRARLAGPLRTERGDAGRRAAARSRRRTAGEHADTQSVGERGHPRAQRHRLALDPRRVPRGTSSRRRRRTVVGVVPRSDRAAPVAGASRGRRTRPCCGRGRSCAIPAVPRRGRPFSGRHPVGRSSTRAERVPTSASTSVEPDVLAAGVRSCGAVPTPTSVLDGASWATAATSPAHWS